MIEAQSQAFMFSFGNNSFYYLSLVKAYDIVWYG